MATISPTKIALLSRRPNPTQATYYSSHPLWGTTRQPHWGFPQEGGSGSRRPRKDRWGEEAVLHTHTRHLHPNEPHVGLQKIADAQLRATNKDSGPSWCILEPGRISRLFVLLINDQYIGPHLPGSLHQKVLGTLPFSEVELQEFQILPLNLRSSSWKIGRLPHARGCGTQPTRSASRITGVFTTPKRVKSLQEPSSTRLPSAKHKSDTTSAFSTVSSRSLISRDLVETRAEISALSPTAWSSFAETFPPFWGPEGLPPSSTFG